jgi:hypothetical protein
VPFSLLLSLFFEPEMLKPVTPPPLPKPTLAPKLAELPLDWVVVLFTLAAAVRFTSLVP